MRRWMESLSLRQQALFGALLLAVLSFPCQLTGRISGTLMTLVLAGVLMAGLWLRLKRAEPYPPGPAAIGEALLLTGEPEIGAVQAPARSCGSARINAGPSMLLLAHAALLTLPENETGRAIASFFSPMNMNAGALQSRMPLVGTAERDGILWQLRQDGSGVRAFACAPAELLLPVCRRLQELQPALLRRGRREELLQSLQAQETAPLCYAMAQVEDGCPADAVYLGALLPRAALVPWAGDEISALRALQLEVRVPPSLAERLDCDADDGSGVCFVPADTDEPGCVTVPAGLRPSEWIGEQRRVWKLLRETLIQTAAVMAAAVIGCAFLEPMCAGLLAAAALVMAMQLQDDDMAVQPAAGKRRRFRLAAVLALATAGCAALGLYLPAVGLRGGCGLPAVIPLTLLLWAAMCRQARTRPSLRQAAVPALAVAAAAVTAVLSGSGLTAAVFSLLCGCLLAVLAAIIALTGKET